MNRIGDRIRELRTQKGLSQRQLGEATGVTQGAIGHIENGNKEPSLQLAVLLADALGTTVNDLVSIAAESESDPA